MAIEAIAYFEEIIAHKEKQPQSDLISHLIMARDEDKKLTQDEILGFCIQLLIVGQETTKGFIGNAVLALLQNRKQWQELRENPHIIAGAVEELLRYDSPIQLIVRFALEDVEIRDKKIQIGDRITLWLGAANRDPERYPKPDKLDFSRQESNLAFGGGIHLCLGHILAKVQGQIAINSLIQKFPNLQLNPEGLERRDGFVFRGLNSLRTINN